jgi:hypothetical protein
MRIGLISDTHLPRQVKHLGELGPQVSKFLAGVDLILHGGDVVLGSVFDWCEQFAPVLAATGNNDYFTDPRMKPLQFLERPAPCRRSSSACSAARSTSSSAGTPTSNTSGTTAVTCWSTPAAPSCLTSTRPGWGRRRCSIYSRIWCTPRSCSLERLRGCGIPAGQVRSHSRVTRYVEHDGSVIGRQPPGRTEDADARACDQYTASHTAFRTMTPCMRASPSGSPTCRPTSMCIHWLRPRPRNSCYAA